MSDLTIPRISARVIPLPLYSVHDNTGMCWIPRAGKDVADEEVRTWNKCIKDRVPPDPRYPYVAHQLALIEEVLLPETKNDPNEQAFIFPNPFDPEW